MYVEHISLATSGISQAVDTLRHSFDAAYRSRFGHARGRGLYTEDDWRRISSCYELVRGTGGSFLDVGVGPGALLNLLTLDPSISMACGIDIRRYTKLVEVSGTLDIRIMSVDNMSFSDREFDTVVCMEVLEHISLPQFLKALTELRRVAKHRLFMTVPLDEPEPLPSYHKLRFTLRDVRTHFPDADFFLMTRKKGVPWLGILEKF